MRPRFLELRIEELLLHGLGRLNRADLGLVVQRELRRLFIEQVFRPRSCRTEP